VTFFTENCGNAIRIPVCYNNSKALYHTIELSAWIIHYGWAGKGLEMKSRFASNVEFFSAAPFYYLVCLALKTKYVC
jgi:hypothetical protein